MYIRKTELIENGNFSLFAAENGSLFSLVMINGPNRHILFQQTCPSMVNIETM